MRTFHSHSPAETEQAGEWLSKRLSPGDLVAFSGGMGMGKTVFVRGLARGLGIDADVSSPTFTLINEYRGETSRLCHMDAYRLTSAEELEATGFYDYLDNGWIAAVEWSETVGLLDGAAVRVRFERLGDNERRITIEGAGI